MLPPVPPAEKPTRILLISNCPETIQGLNSLYLLANSSLIEKRNLELLLSDTCEQAREFLANGFYENRTRVCHDPPELIIFDLAASSLSCILSLSFDVKQFNRFNVARKKITAICLSAPYGPQPPRFYARDGVDAFHPKIAGRAKLVGRYIWLGTLIKKHHKEQSLIHQLRMDQMLRSADVKVRTYFM